MSNLTTLIKLTQTQRKTRRKNKIIMCEADNKELYNKSFLLNLSLSVFALQNHEMILEIGGHYV